MAAVAEQAREFLTLDKLQFPASLPIVELEVEDYVDWTGDDALRINAYIDEAASGDDVNVRDLFAFKDAVRSELQRHGIDLFPYIHFPKRSELEAARKEMEEED
jgi:hypothetical protein